MRRVPRAFSLAEVLVVLALAAVLTGTAALSLRGAARAARAEDVAGLLASFDRSAREAAWRLGAPLELRFDLGRGTVHRAGGDGDESLPLRLPEGFRVAELVLADGGAVTAGEVRLAVSARRQTPSYAVRVEGAGGESIWLVAAGLSGRTVVLSDASDVEDIFATESADRRPAGAGGGTDAD